MHTHIHKYINIFFGKCICLNMWQVYMYINDSILNFAVISLSMYKIKAFIKKKKLFQTLVLILFMIENVAF